MPALLWLLGLGIAGGLTWLIYTARGATMHRGWSIMLEEVERPGGGTGYVWSATKNGETIGDGMPYTSDVLALRAAVAAIDAREPALTGRRAGL